MRLFLPIPLQLMMTLLWAVVCTWNAASWLAVFFYKVTVSALIGWRVRPQAEFNILFNQDQSIPKPEASPQYQMSYEAAALLAERQSLSELHATLRRFLPTAQSESEWGALDAVADEIQKRDEQKPVL